MNPSDSTSKVIQTLNFIKINFKNNENKFLSLAYRCKNDDAVLSRFDGNEVPIFSSKKYAFVNKVLTLMLIYRQQSMQMQELFQLLQYFLTTNYTDVIARDVSCDLLKVFYSLIDYVYIKKNLMEEFSTNATFQNIYFSNHDAVRIVSEKIAADFQTIR